VAWFLANVKMDAHLKDVHFRVMVLMSAYGLLTATAVTSTKFIYIFRFSVYIYT
jgi:hypothetical protein